MVKRSAMKTASLLAGIALCFSCQLTATPASDNPATRTGRWQEDLDFFARELAVRQKDLFKLIPKEEFDRKVAELRSEVPKLSDAEIVLQLMRLLARLGVGHTQVKPMSAISIHALHVYPIQMQWFSDGLAVVAAAPNYQGAPGSRVVRIGLMTPRQVEAAVAPYIPHENDAHLHAESPRYMTMVELMRQEKIADPDGRLLLTCAKAGRGEFTLEIGSEGSSKTSRKLVNAADAMQVPTALCYKHPKAFYWYEYLPQTHTLYIQCNQCTNEPGNPFVNFTRNLFAFADTHPVQRVVVDLRFNGGGTPGIVKPLADGLKSRPALRAKGHLYTLIAWRTFSAAMNMALSFRKHLDAILVGEPAGNKPNHYGQAESFMLPNSRLKVQYSTQYVRQIHDADPLSLDPDIFVPYSLNDFLAGRDPVLEAALHHPLQ
jgi:hypothetical protein